VPIVPTLSQGARAALPPKGSYQLSDLNQQRLQGVTAINHSRPPQHSPVPQQMMMFPVSARSRRINLQSL
jgi:hypothetical protein